MTDNKFLQEQSKEQLIIFIHNDEAIIENLRDRLRKLTGCGDFGNGDGTVGTCVMCSYDNPELFERCWEFQHRKTDPAAK